MLAASPTTLPIFLALNGCGGPAVLNGPPPVSDQTTMLLHAVTTEQNLIWIYNKAVVTYSSLAPTLSPLLAEHESHLAQLRGRVIEPPGRRVPLAATARPAIGATEAAALARLRTAERTAIATLMSRLGGASGSLAQLYASIAASEATHVTTLTSRIGS